MPRSRLFRRAGPDEQPPSGLAGLVDDGETAPVTMCRNRASSSAAKRSVSEAPAATTIRADARPRLASLVPATIGPEAAAARVKAMRHFRIGEAAWDIMGAF